MDWSRPYARRSFIVPRVASWEELNFRLQQECRQRRDRNLLAGEETIAQRFERDREKRKRQTNPYGVSAADRGVMTGWPRNVPPKRSSAFWRAIVSGAARAEYCRQQGISINMLAYYLHRQTQQVPPRMARVRLASSSASSAGMPCGCATADASKAPGTSATPIWRA